MKNLYYGLMDNVDHLLWRYGEDAALIFAMIVVMLIIA